jgi:hypothetical protein
MQQFVSMQQMQMQQFQQSMMSQFKEMDHWIHKKLNSSPKKPHMNIAENEGKDDESSNSDSCWIFII